MKVLRKMSVLLPLMFVIGCLGTLHNLKDGQTELTLIKGEIDHYRSVEVFSQKSGETMINLVGFKRGYGTIIRGIHPGLREEKKVKLYLKRVADENYKGSAVYDVIRIDSGDPEMDDK